MDIPVAQHINNLLVLERQLGTKVDYKIHEPPFLMDQGDIISLQSAAKELAGYIGLSNLIFIVAIAKQKEKIGGHIDLRSNQNEVFIEISEDVLKYKNSVLATLAHEITHKFLQINGITLPDEKMNEILTDTASVYLGFGKIMLNGCENYTTKHEKDWNGEKTITETLCTGYLNRDQFAFIYKLVCIMHNIPYDEYGLRLSHDAQQALDDVSRQHQEYFNVTLNSKSELTKLADKLLIEIRQFQSLLSNIEKSCIYIQKGGIATIENFVGEMHRSLSKTIEESKLMLSDECFNPSLNYLNIIVSKEKITERKKEIENCISRAKSLQNFSRKLAKAIQKNVFFPMPSKEMFNILTCWNDNVKLRLPQNAKRIVAKCPKCKYQFSADTTIDPITNSVIGRKIKEILNKLFKKESQAEK